MSEAVRLFSIVFDVSEREIVGGSQWALDALIEGQRWTLATWTQKPSESEIGFAKHLAVRAIKAFYTATTAKPFDADVESL